jgi:hypothetical protein
VATPSVVLVEKCICFSALSLRCAVMGWESEAPTKQSSCRPEKGNARRSSRPHSVLARVLYGLGADREAAQGAAGPAGGPCVGVGRPGLRMGGVGGVNGEVPWAVGPQHGGGVPI